MGQIKKIDVWYNEDKVGLTIIGIVFLLVMIWIHQVSLSLIMRLWYPWIYFGYPFLINVIIFGGFVTFGTVMVLIMDKEEILPRGWRKMSFQVFRWLCRLAWGTGLGKLPTARRIYGFLYSIIMRPNEIVSGEFEGQKMFFYTNDTHGMTAQLFLGGHYEIEETSLFKSVVGKGMTVVDLGANIGYYTLLAAKLVGSKGKVFAFEPGPDNYSLLLKNIEANGHDNVIPVQKAVSDKTGETNLYLCGINKGDHRIYDPHDGRESVTVGVTTLDAFMKDHQCTVDVIKMDIQGAEMAALQGMTDTVLKNGNLKLITEFWPGILQDFGFSPSGFLDRLVELGFSLYVVTSKGPWIRPVDVSEVMGMCKNDGFLNLFCQKAKDTAIK